MMNRYLMLILASAACHGAAAESFNTSWITPKPEVLTYHTTAKEGDGLYQVSIWKTAGGIELYMNIIAPGFTKSVWGSMAADLHQRAGSSWMTRSSWRPNATTNRAGSTSPLP